MLLERIKIDKTRPLIWLVLLIPVIPAVSAQTENAVANRITATLRHCESSPPNGGTFQQASCYNDEDTRQNQLLNKEWRKTIVAFTPARRALLRASERRWIVKRDVKCKMEAADYINSTAAYMFNVCYARETIRRLIWLEHLRRTGLQRHAPLNL